jgi:hypothetical protein
MRHDVDLSIEKALEMAILENKLNVSSTYFFLLTSDFYNISNISTKNTIRKIHQLGHNIGLHFDEKQYIINNVSDFTRELEKEKQIFQSILELEIHMFSNHRPSNFVLNGLADDYLTLKNAYSKTFFREMKYLSDSRMNWREDVDELINSKKNSRYQICIHPFWYSAEKYSIIQVFEIFISKSKEKLLRSLDNNIKDFHTILKFEEE